MIFLLFALFASSSIICLEKSKSEHSEQSLICFINDVGGKEKNESGPLLLGNSEIDNLAKRYYSEPLVHTKDDHTKLLSDLKKLNVFFSTLINSLDDQPCSTSKSTKLKILNVLDLLKNPTVSQVFGQAAACSLRSGDLYIRSLLCTQTEQQLKLLLDRAWADETPQRHRQKHDQRISNLIYRFNKDVIYPFFLEIKKEISKPKNKEIGIEKSENKSVLFDRNYSASYWLKKTMVGGAEKSNDVKKVLKQLYSDASAIESFFFHTFYAFNKDVPGFAELEHSKITYSYKPMLLLQLLTHNRFSSPISENISCSLRPASDYFKVILKKKNLKKLDAECQSETRLCDDSGSMKKFKDVFGLIFTSVIIDFGREIIDSEIAALNIEKLEEKNH